MKLIRIDQRKKGFSLLECMLALAIFLMAVVGVAGAIQTLGKHSLDGRERGVICKHMESILNEIRYGPPLESGDLDFGKGPLGNRYRASVREGDWESEQGEELSGLWRIELRAIDAEDTVIEEVSVIQHEDLFR